MMRRRRAITLKGFLLLLTAMAIPVIPGATTPVKANETCRFDMIRIAGTLYEAVAMYAHSTRVAESDLGPHLGTLTTLVTDHGPCTYDLLDGDATIRTAGTEVYTLTSFRPTFRVATRDATGELILYQAHESLVAKTGEDLLDVRGRVVRMWYTPWGYCDDNGCSSTVPQSIEDRIPIDATLALLLPAPVDPTRIVNDNDTYTAQERSIYSISFDLDDGTTAEVTVFRELGQTSNGIVVPDTHQLDQIARGGYPIWLDGSSSGGTGLNPANIDYLLALEDHVSRAHLCSFPGLPDQLVVEPNGTIWFIVNVPPGRYELVCVPPEPYPSTTERITLIFKERPYS